MESSSKFSFRRLGIFLLGLITGTPIAHWPGKREVRSGGDIIDDPELLAKAEQETRAIPNQEFVPAATLESIEGYSEAYVVELLKDLWDQGIDATFDQLPAVGGTMRSFIIKCPREQLDDTRKFIRERTGGTRGN